MAGTENHGGTLKILLLGMSRSERNTLKMLLPRRLKRQLAFSDQPDDVVPGLMLLCFDHQDTRRQWPGLRQQYAGCAAIGMAHDVKVCTDLPMLPRPVQIGPLVEQIDRVLADGSDAPATLVPRKPDTTPSRKLASGSDTDMPRPFQVKRKIIGELLKARDLQRDTGEHVLLEGMGVFLFLRDGRVFSNNSCKVVRSLCVPEILPETFSIRTLDARAAEEVLLAHGNGHFYSRDQFLWEVATYVSRGALPADLSAGQPLQLKRWPDCTQFPQPLMMAAISAQLSQQPLSVQQLVEQTGLPRKAVAEYASAGYLLSFLGAGGQAKQKRHGKAHPWSKNLLGQFARRIASRVAGGRWG